MKQVILFIFLLWVSQSVNRCFNISNNSVPDRYTKGSEKTNTITNPIKENNSELLPAKTNIYPTENILISPLMASTVVAKTYSEAEGDTKQAIQETLIKNGVLPADINGGYHTLVLALRLLDEDAVYKIANSIYIRNNFVLKDEINNPECNL